MTKDTILFSHLKFDNRFRNNLPADTENGNFPRQVSGAAYSNATPQNVSQPRLVSVNSKLGLTLGFSATELQSENFAQVFSGNKIATGMSPYAMCYGGDQFGHWAGQLGDGRAINLGEVVTQSGGYQTLQLKGAGPTPYSRTADGLAVLRSSIREYLCSEAMHHLGIATTRALSLCLTGDKVMRDMFYDGNAKLEKGAVVCRVSSSFMRFGSFQLPANRGDTDLLKAMADHCIKSDFPHLGEPSKQVYLAWFKEICDRTCALMVDWARVGFVHGVMNTDNMSIIGETIDFGPYGWIDDFDLSWTPNTTDAQGRRYRFGAQAQISQWNLFQLANAIFPLINEVEPLQQLINDYADQYQQQWLKMMSNKLGFSECLANDQQLITELEELLGDVETDMTLFYRQLALLPLPLLPSQSSQLENNTWMDVFECCYYQIEQITPQYQENFTAWLAKYIARALIDIADDRSQQQRQQAMNAVNPIYVLRNYLAQQAIELAEQGDFSEIHQLEKVLQQPYEQQDEFASYAQKRPDWARNKAGCSMLSCSS